MADDTFRMMCPSLKCKRILTVPENSRGKHVRCKNCGTTIKVPEKPAVPQIKPAPTDAA